MVTASFWNGKKVFVTGHTGFKGSWLCCALLKFGAQVTGYSLPSPPEPSLYNIIGLSPKINEKRGDIRDYKRLEAAFRAAAPDIVFHLAAQPIVRESYADPRYTYETNVMGTVNILQCLCNTEAIRRSFLNVTTDKVYKNNEWHWGYREIDPLDGYDPYSNSKSCSELVTHSYKSSFFSAAPIAISTARAGNVIGGGDFAKDRIIPDCIRAAINKEPVIVRNPHSTRPYQHVLEPITAYMAIAEKQYKEKNLADYYNVGPDDTDCVTTGDLTQIFCNVWGEGMRWENRYSGDPHEANSLKLDCSKIKSQIGWKPKWHIETAIEKTCEWTKAWISNKDIHNIMDSQIDDYVINGVI